MKIAPIAWMVAIVSIAPMAIGSTPPGPPMNFDYEFLEDGTMQLTWEPPPSEIGPGAVSYVVYQYIDGEALDPEPVSGLSFDALVPENALFVVHVRAVGADASEGPPSAQVTAMRYPHCAVVVLDPTPASTFLPVQVRPECLIPPPVGP